MLTPAAAKPAGRLVITVHGIRTYGNWQSALGEMLEGADPSVSCVHYQFGYFSALAFLIPFVRDVVVRRFLRSLDRCCHQMPWASIDIVCHSFGTYVVANALLRWAPERRVRIRTLILAGSVLRSSFPVDALLDQAVDRTVNECGLKDHVLLLSQLFSIGTGMAGRIGLVGMQEARFRNRYWEIGHSGYFDSGWNFMRSEWVPLLTTDTPTRPRPDPRAVAPLEGLWLFFINNADVVKTAVWLTPVVALALYLNALRLEADARRAQATMALAALTAEQGRIGDALDTVARDRAIPADFRHNLQASHSERAVVWDTDGGSQFEQVVRQEGDTEVEFDVDDIWTVGDDHLIAQGWYNGVLAIRTNADGAVMAPCGLPSRFNVVRIASNRQFLSLVNSDGDFELRDKWCTKIDPAPANPPRGKVVLAVPGDSESMVWLGTSDGRLFRMGEQSPLFADPERRSIAHLWISSGGSHAAIVNNQGQLRLVDLRTRQITAESQLRYGEALSLTDSAWRPFLARVPNGDRVAVVRTQQREQGSMTSVMALWPTSAGIARGLWFGPRDHEREAVLSAQVIPDSSGRCAHMRWATQRHLWSVEIEPSCDGTELQTFGMPTQVSVQAVALCPDGTVVLGGSRGDVAWAGVPPFGDALQIEHIERSWPEQVTAVTCSAEGVVHAGFRARGIKKFDRQFSMTTTPATGPDDDDSFVDAVYAEEQPDQPREVLAHWDLRQVWPGHTLHLDGSRGVVSVRSESTLLWSRQLASTTQYRTATTVDYIDAVTVHHDLAQVSVLTSLGTFTVLDLRSGMVVARKTTPYFAAGGATPYQTGPIRRDGSMGQFHFTHGYEDGGWFRVAIGRQVPADVPLRNAASK